jgi:DNA-binding NarL/FixJ family response regulator
MNEQHVSPPDVTIFSQSCADKTQRIFIIGHRDFSLDGLASMLEGQDHAFQITCMEPAADCIDGLLSARPRALLLHNESLPQPFERFLNEIFTQLPETRILVFGKDMGDDYLYSLVRSGVHGYINERMGGDHFKRALDNVLAGKIWVERHILERFVSHQQNFDRALETQFADRIERLCAHLTHRETEILSEVIKGLAIKQIAEQVHLSHQGVKMHLAKLFKKFNVTNRNQLILAAFDEMSPVENLSVLLRKGLNKKLGSKFNRN